MIALIWFIAHNHSQEIDWDNKLLIIHLFCLKSFFKKDFPFSFTTLSLLLHYEWVTRQGEAICSRLESTPVKPVSKSIVPHRYIPLDPVCFYLLFIGCSRSFLLFSYLLLSFSFNVDSSKLDFFFPLPSVVFIIVSFLPLVFLSAEKETLPSKLTEWNLDMVLDATNNTITWPK